MKTLLKILLAIVALVLLVSFGFGVANRLAFSEMEEYIDGIEPAEYEAQLVPELDEYGNYFFTTDEDFKILHLTDIHIGGGVLSMEKDKKAINAVAAMVLAEKPDLVITTGDIAFAIPTTGTINNGFAHLHFAHLMERLGVYWTVTFGNHDTELYDLHNREYVSRMYADGGYQHCLFSRGPAEISGEGNHLINIKDSRGLVTQTLFMIDSHSYTDKDPLGLLWDYEYIKQDQIDWYKSQLELYEEYNKTKPDLISSRAYMPKSLVFFHIPLVEVRDAYNEFVNNDRQNTANVEYLGGNDGESMPMVYCSNTDNDFFETMVELGSTQAFFYGHDHLNNFVFKYKGITMSYGMSIDYLAYDGIDEVGFQRGCQVITVDTYGRFDFTHENYYQDKYVSPYEKEIVNMDKDAE